MKIPRLEGLDVWQQTRDLVDGPIVNGEWQIVERLRIEGLGAAGKWLNIY